jgi:hypothetical protein
MFYAFIGYPPIAFGAVMHLQRVASIAQAATVAVYDKACVTFGLPRGGTDVAFVSSAVHSVLCWAGSLPRLAAPRPARPHPSQPCLITPSLALPCTVKPDLASHRQTRPRRALLRLVSWSPVSGGVSLPCTTAPRLTKQSPASPSPAQPDRAESSRALSYLERNAKACSPVGSSQLAEGCAGCSTDKQAFAYDVQTTKYPVKHPSAVTFYYRTPVLSIGNLGGCLGNT